MSFQVDTLTETVGKYATDKGYKQVVLMAPNYQAGKDMLSGFKRLYKGTVVDEVYTPLNQLDFSAEITQPPPPSPMLVPSLSGVARTIRQYQQAGLLKTIPLLSTGTIDGTSLPALKETALGAVQWPPVGARHRQPGQPPVRRREKEEWGIIVAIYLQSPALLWDAG